MCHIYVTFFITSQNYIYYINTSEIPGELSHVNISSHVEITCSFTRENIMLFSRVLRVPLLLLHNLLKSTQMCCCMIETLSVPPRKSSENVRKMFGNVRLAFATILENLRKVVGNLQKIVVISIFIE